MPPPERRPPGPLKITKERGYTAPSQFAAGFFVSRVLARRIKTAEMPGFIKPQLATLKAKAPSGDNWIHEIKYDGYRVQLHVDHGTKKAYTRNGLNWTKRFSAIAGAFDLPGQAIIDGEVVVVHEGRTNFPNSKPISPRAPRIVCYITPSISYGSTARTCAKGRRLSARRC